MKNKLALAAALFATSFSVSADGLSYSSLELGYNKLKIDTSGSEGNLSIGDHDGSGPYFKGSIALGKTMYVFGGVNGGDGDIPVRVTEWTWTGSRELRGSMEANVSQYYLGFGFHADVSEKTHVVTEFSAIQTNAKFGQVRIEDMRRRSGVEVSATDVRVAVGFRRQFAKHFEGSGKVSYTGGEGYENEFAAILGAQVNFNQTWGIVGEAELGGTIPQYRVGLRASF